MHKPCDPKGVNSRTLQCLILHPKGTEGWANEWDVIVCLNYLCNIHGHSRVSQLAKYIEDIWKHENDVVHRYKEIQRRTLEEMKEAEKKTDA